MKTHRATLVVDLGFGDGGKGTIVDFLARRGGVSAVVRYNGACQAAHNVVTPDGRHHTFRQFGSGTFVPGVRTHLSRFMLINPLEMAVEAKHLREMFCRNPYERLSVDEDAPVITPFHQTANVIRERMRGTHAHGSCGMGVGETMSLSLAHPDATIYAKDLKDTAVLEKKIRRIRDYLFEDLRKSVGLQFIRDQSLDAEWWYPTRLLQWTSMLAVAARDIKVVPRAHLQVLAGQGSLIFEGAQGVLLDEWYGFHPHTTWSTTTTSNAQTLLDEIGYDGEAHKLGVLRAYHTRHGAGPFVTEDAGLTRLLPDRHNGDQGWQGVFRVGWFDLVMARYALAVCGGVDSIAMTNLDRFPEMVRRKICTAYRFDELSREEEALLLEVIRGKGNSSVLAGGIKQKQVLTDLAYQEALTHLLKKATPLYETVRGNIEDYLTTIEGSLGTPVSLASYGPTAGDKRLRTAVQTALAA